MEEEVAKKYSNMLNYEKDRLEKFEYILQFNEYKYAEYDRLLKARAGTDSETRKFIEDYKLIVRDRKIINSVVENFELKNLL